MDKSEVEARIAAAEAERLNAEQRLRERTERLNDVEAERESLLGEIGLARQALADFQEYRERLRRELAEAELEEARAAVQEAVRLRDEELAGVSRAVVDLTAAVERADAARAALGETHRRLRTLDPQTPATPAPEPARLQEQWMRVASLVEAELRRARESELVEQAARSPDHRLIASLPEHLRSLAMQRKRDFLEASHRR
jgi:chromosome segregation ATPase